MTDEPGKIVGASPAASDAGRSAATQTAAPRILHDADIREPLFDYLEAYYGKVRFIAAKLADRVPVEILHRQVSEELFERDYTLL